jgi:hypothetical protein
MRSSFSLAAGSVTVAARGLGQRLRREPDTRAAMEQLETNPSDPVIQERLAEQLTGKLKDPAFREDLQALLEEGDERGDEPWLVNITNIIGDTRERGQQGGPRPGEPNELSGALQFAGSGMPAGSRRCRRGRSVGPSS